MPSEKILKRSSSNFLDWRNLLTVIVVLLAFACCTTEADRNRMETLLDRADSMNRVYIPMTDGIDSLLLEATHFYDRHGTANEQMRAHYLLGCAYRDKGEAPAALQSYQDAVDRADTLSSDCDYRRLMSIYGQMAELFHAQNLPEDELAQRVKYGKYAVLIGDTLLYIRNLELLVKPYFLMRDTMGMLKVIQQAHNLFTSHGHTQEAAAVLGSVIDYNIAKGRLDKASKLMNVYEAQSGLFGQDGNIASGREFYYYIKGTYYLKRHEFSLAEQWFRKLPSTEKKDAYKGLLSVFRLQNKLDSVAKYTYLYENALDSLHNKMQTEAIHQMSSLYNYQQFKEKAEKEQKKASQRTIIIWICVGIIIVICLLTFIVIRELIRKRKTAEQKYMQSLSVIEQAQSDIVKLQTNAEINKELISEKEQIIREQETIMKSLLRHDSNSQSLADRKLIDTDIYKRFEQLSTKGQQPTQEEWEQIEQQVFICYPGFKDLLYKHESAINDKEYKTCLLIRIGIKPTNISSMLGVASSYITELRTKMLQKLFGMSGSSKSFDKLLKTIY